MSAGTNGQSMPQIDVKTIDAGMWTVEIVAEHAIPHKQKRSKLSFAEMLAMLLTPMGIALNREQRVVFTAWRNGIKRIEIRIGKDLDKEAE